MADPLPKKTSELDFTEIADSLVVNRGNDTYRISSDAYGQQLLETGPVSLALRNASLGLITCSSWPALEDIIGGRDGQTARVLAGDTGDHVDPVSGETVANTGEFVWVSIPPGWLRIGDIFDVQDLIQIANDAKAAAETAIGLVGAVETALQPGLPLLAAIEAVATILPTSLPSSSGKLWNNGGLLSIS